jgi:alkylhydroperoxidase family enzyme
LLRTTEGSAKVRQVLEQNASEGFGELEDVALEVAKAITRDDRDVDDDLFQRARRVFSEEQLVELACWICLENFYSRFNRTFRVPAQGFCVLP